MEEVLVEIKLVKNYISEMEHVEKMKNIFSYPSDFTEATKDWIVGDDNDGEIFFITANKEIVGITGWYSIEEGKYGLRWHGVFPDYRNNGYSRLAISLLYRHLVDIECGWISLYEISPNENTAEYFFKQNFKRVRDNKTCDIVVESGGDIGDSIVLEYNASSLHIVPLFNSIEQMYNVKISRFYDGYGDGNRNYGASAGNDIYLAPYDDPDLEIAACFHELGHILSGRELFPNKNKQYFTCKLTAESVAWEIGFREMAKAGFCLHYNSKEYEYARKSLASYIGGEYDDVIHHSKLYQHSLRCEIDKDLGIIR